jgi:AcrR family transcriptional regulator
MSEPRSKSQQRRQQQKEQTYQDLVAAAFTVFCARGYTNATVDEIAATAGYTKGAVYAHFATKDALFLAVFDRFFADHLGANAEQSFVQDVAQNRSWYVAITEFVGYAIRNEAVRSELAQRYRQLHATILPHLPPSERAQEIAWGIIALSHGMTLLAYILPTVDLGEHYDELLARLMMGGHAPPTLGDAVQSE